MSSFNVFFNEKFEHPNAVLTLVNQILSLLKEEMSAYQIQL